MTAFCRETSDLDLIRSYLGREQLAEAVQGATEPREGWRYFEIAGDGGLICFQPIDDGWLLHSLAVRSGVAVEAAKEAMQAIGGKVIAMIPVEHWPALRAAILCGMKYTGRTDENHILERING